MTLFEKIIVCAIAIVAGWKLFKVTLDVILTYRRIQRNDRLRKAWRDADSKYWKK